MLIGLPKAKLRKTSTGVTSMAICVLEPTAISKERLILFFIAIVIAVKCSAALPIIGIIIMPIKNDDQPRVAVTDSMPLTRYSLSRAMNIVLKASMAIALVLLHLAGSDSQLAVFRCIAKTNPAK